MVCLMDRLNKAFGHACFCNLTPSVDYTAKVRMNQL